MASSLPPVNTCSPDCDDQITVQVPGPTGAAGSDGSDGSDGANAYTTATAQFTMPAIDGGTVTVTVGSNAWMAYGQVVAIGDPAGAAPYGYMQVGAKTGTTQVVLTNLETTAGAYASNAAAGTVFPIGTIISPGGLQGVGGSTTGDLLAANNLSDVDDAATSRTNLGLGTLATQAANAVAITGGSVAGITDLAVADGGTGASAAAGARTNLGAAVSGANADITSLTGLTTPLSVAQGGTAGATAAAARAALSAAELGANSSITSLSGLTTPLSVAQGGTGAATAPAALTNLGLEHTLRGTIILLNKQATTVDGGTFTSGAWRTRTLNTEAYDDMNLCTLAANQFTLAEGEYYLRATCPAYKVNLHQARLYNVSTASVVTNGYGTNANSSSTDDALTVSEIFVAFSVAPGGETFEIQHQCQTTANNTGFGIANDFGGDEIYTTVVIHSEID